MTRFQLIRNPKGLTHIAAKNTVADKLVMLSGTPFANKWTDAFAYIDLLPREPFDKFTEILKVFYNDKTDRHKDYPTPLKLNYLIKYFQSFSSGPQKKCLNCQNCTNTLITSS